MLHKIGILQLDTIIHKSYYSQTLYMLRKLKLQPDIIYVADMF